MTVNFPSSYNKFHCISDRCKHSCCVGWGISLDEDTEAKYNALGREDILRHINDGEITLTEDERCPFLTECGLCRLISEFSEEYTSLICREHPRFYHRVCDRIEGGIGLSCEEAARIILGCDDYVSLCNVEWQGDVADETDFDTLPYRERIYDIIGDRSLPFWDRIDVLNSEFSLAYAHTDDEWNGIFDGLDYLYPEHCSAFRVGKVAEGYDEYLERFFAYLVFRHVSIALSEDNLRARLGFCVLLTRMLGRFLAEDHPDLDGICDFARQISEEIEYSVDNTDSLIFEFESCI